MSTANYPPFMNATGLVKTLIQKMKNAATPERFTQDFLGTTLGHSSGSAKAFIPLLKRLGMLSTDGVPTELYNRFKNPSQSKKALAQAIKHGFSQLYTVDEKAHELDKQAIRGIIMQVTGLDSKATTVGAICSTFENLCEFADFSNEDEKNGQSENPPNPSNKDKDNLDPTKNGLRAPLGLSYTINLNLPETTNVAVFDAIFKSLKENLLE